MSDMFQVSLVKIYGRKELRMKNLFCVSDCKMYLQSNGDYLSVKVFHYTKTKKSTYTSFKLFQINGKDIPIEVMELKNKIENIITFVGDPKVCQCVILHGIYLVLNHNFID